MGDAGQHVELVAAALRRLGREPVEGSLEVRLLAGGLSGSFVFRVDLAGEDAVLKVTLPGEARYVVERARRELLFYRDLATRVPVAMPRVLGLDFSETDGVVILLAAYEPSPLPNDWTERDFVQVARELGQFHDVFWGKTAALALPEWLRSAPPVTVAQCRESAKRWHGLGERDDLDDELEAFCRTLERLVMEVPALEARMSPLPTTLCHGDFHADNLLRGSAGEWVWADWQEVRLGPGVSDLAFFWQRAFVAAEMSPPYEAMVAAYRVGLDTIGGVVITEEQLDRALAWAELRSWLVDWPSYLGGLPVTRLERVMRRVEMLIGELKIAAEI